MYRSSGILRVNRTINCSYIFPILENGFCMLKIKKKFIEAFIIKLSAIEVFDDGARER